MTKLISNSKAFKASALALGLMTALLGVVGGNETSVKAQEVEQNVTQEEVANQSEELVGQTVTLRGEVEDRDGSIFRIDDDRFFNGEDILVVNMSGVSIPDLPYDDAEVQVTGEVRSFIVDEVQREFGMGFDADRYVEYENQPVLFAESIALAPSPGEITFNPDVYYGKPVAVEGEVEEIVAANAFTLDEERLLTSEDLLVINLAPGQIPEDDQDVVVTGVVRLFTVVEFERDYDLNWDADLVREIEAEYENKPVLVADGVYMSDE
ncbi:MAG: hypothetical protein WA919_18000 [Coleofasciculaceae cyanobacterium]